MELSSLVRKLGNGSPLPPGAAGSAAEGRRGLPDPSAGLRVCVGGRRGACSTPAYSAVGVSPVKRARRLRVGARPLAWEGAGGAASFLGSRGERRSLPDLRVHTAAPPPRTSRQFSALCFSTLLPAADVGGDSDTRWCFPRKRRRLSPSERVPVDSIGLGRFLLVFFLVRFVSPWQLSVSIVYCGRSFQNCVLQEKGRPHVLPLASDYISVFFRISHFYTGQAYLISLLLVSAIMFLFLVSIILTA